jgi:hypothetical protein
MTVIELPDQQAAALKAKAAAQGLTLEAWLKKLADDGGVPAAGMSPKEVVARIREIRSRTKPDPEGGTIRDYINYGRR